MDLPSPSTRRFVNSFTATAHQERVNYLSASRKSLSDLSSCEEGLNSGGYAIVIKYPTAQVFQRLTAPLSHFVFQCGKLGHDRGGDGGQGLARPVE